MYHHNVKLGRAIERLLHVIVVHDCRGTKKRFGGRNDGGYVLLSDLLLLSKNLYSFGVGTDVEFELSLVDELREVHLFDPTIDKLPVDHDKFCFHKSAFCGESPKFLTVLKNVEPNSLLKVDVEWDEWYGFRVMPFSTLARFSQMIVEFHLIHLEGIEDGYTDYFRQFYRSVWDRVNADLFDMYAEVLTRLRQHFYIFHIHANNSLPRVEVNGLRFPPLIEISFVRKDLMEQYPKKFVGVFPVKGLDSPNKTDRPDIEDFYPFVGKIGG